MNSLREIIEASPSVRHLAFADQLTSEPQPLAAAPSGHGTAAILLAGLLIGTAIVASSGSPPQGWSWIRDLASVGFVVALVASGLLLAGVVRRLRRDADGR